MKIVNLPMALRTFAIDNEKLKSNNTMLFSIKINSFGIRLEGFVKVASEKSNEPSEEETPFSTMSRLGSLQKR